MPLPEYNTRRRLRDKENAATLQQCGMTLRVVNRDAERRATTLEEEQIPRR